MATDVKTPADDAVARYLDRYDQALAGIAPARRDELVQEMIERIVDKRWALPDRDDEAAVHDMLKQIGPPEEIAVAVRAANLPPAPPGGVLGEDGREKLAILLLLFGGFAGGIGWLAGVVLLWLSPRWRDRDKLIGTFLLPGGLVLSLVIFLFAMGTVWVGSSSGDLCSSPFGDGCTGQDIGSMVVWLIVAFIAVFAPLGSAVHLWNRLDETRPESA